MSSFVERYFKESVVVVKDLKSEYEGRWRGVVEKVDWIDRTDPHNVQPSASIHLIVEDKGVTILKGDESMCGNLWGTFSR